MLPQNEVYNMVINASNVVKGGERMAEKLSVKQWRMVRGLSQNSMAEKIGVHEHTYRAMERNPMHVRLYKLIQICNVLGVSINDIDMRSEEPEEAEPEQEGE